MTIAEADRFYEQDSRKYDLSKNKELQNWLKDSIKNGYHSFIDIEHLQELIDRIAHWYEIKYPEREMEFYEGTIYFDFENIKSLSKVMDMKQLMYRLPHRQLCLIECDYRSYGEGIEDVYNEDGKVVGHKSFLFMRINKKDIDHNTLSTFNEIPYFLLQAYSDDGAVCIDRDLSNNVSVDNINLDDLLLIFKEKYDNKLEFKELEECIHDHNCDIELRRQILQLVALKLIYSQNTIPARGYERAKRFINEFNKKLGIILSTAEIDEIMNRDYTNGERWETVRNTYIDEKGEEHSYLTVEDVALKDNSIKDNKIMKFIKKMRR